MTYEEARAFLEETKRYGSVPGLENITALMAKLSDVQEELKIVHVAGTNGKGSVCAMIAQILREAGYCVGVYHSPAVFFDEEIFQINGVFISREDYAACMERVKRACDDLTSEGSAHPTAFEIETALAFFYFYEKKCDIAVIETGMGGALDATNLIKRPLVSVLTNISRDHMAFLGDSPAEIAEQKAGIIKEGRPVVCACQSPQAMEVIKKRAGDKNAALSVVDSKALTEAHYDAEGMDFVYRPGGTKSLSVHLSLTGEYQKKNALLAILAAEELKRQGYRIADREVKEGLKNARLAGRFETVCLKPRIILDGAHNEGAARELLSTVRNCFTNCPITYIIGMLADKEYEKVLEILLPYARKVYTVTPDNERALSGEILCEKAKKFHSDVTDEESVAAALAHAVAGAKKSEVILAFGSLSYLREVKEACMAWRRS